MLKDVEDRERELLSKYYKLRGESVEVTLVYNTFSELVDPNYGDDRVEKLSNKLFDSIELAFREIPVQYSILLNIKIKDFGNYNQDEAIKIIRENIEMRLHTISRIDKKKKLSSTFVMLVGLAFIVASYFVPRREAGNIFYELVDLAGQVFVWEGMYSYFLDRTENKLLTRQYRKKLHSIKISKFGEDAVMQNISIKGGKATPDKVVSVPSNTATQTSTIVSNSATIENADTKNATTNSDSNTENADANISKIANIKWRLCFIVLNYLDLR